MSEKVKSVHLIRTLVTSREQALNFRLSQEEGNFSSIWATINFSSNTMSHGYS
jgi:hypothetical protein